MSKKVIISVTNDLETDQRVHKVTNFLYSQGYEVLLVGRKLKSSSADFSRDYPTKRMRLWFSHGPLFYAEYNIRLFLFLLFASYDILLSNDTDTLLANYYASKIRRKKLVFDAHELFPEVPELQGRKSVQKVWELIERHIFPRLKYAYTVCASISDYYKEKYGIEMHVVRNVPYKKDFSKVESQKFFTGKKILLYQGAVNVGRGLEYVIDAMPFLDDFVLMIVGTGDIINDLEQRVHRLKVDDRVVFVGKVPFERLDQYTVMATIGLSILDNQGLSYYYSLPNRIFDFVQAGVPILASDFPEIHRVIESYKIGEFAKDLSPEKLANQIKDMADKWENNPNKKQLFAVAADELNWENESKIIRGIFEKL